MKAKQKIVIGLYVFLLVALLLIGFLSGYLTRPIVARSALYVVILFVSLFFTNTKHTKQTKQNYLQSYKSYLLDAFSDNKQLQDTLLNAVDAYVNKRLRDCKLLLDQLRPRCKTDNERFAVACYTGFCCDDMMLYEDAIRAYEYALQFRQYAAIASNLGLCWEHLGDYNKALDIYQAASRYDSTHPTPYNNSAQIYMRTGRYAKAIEVAQKAYDLDNKMTSALNALTVCHYLLGNMESYKKYHALALAAGSDANSIKNYITKRQEADNA